MTATRTAPRSSRPSAYSASPRSRRQRSTSRRSSAPPSPQNLAQNVAPLRNAFRSPSNSFQRSEKTAPQHPPQPSPQNRSLPGHRRKNRRLYYLSLISEAGLKILINGLLLSAFAVALGRLLPQMWQNSHQRMAIETELKTTQQRVNTLEQNFSQTFDPRSSISLMEQQSYQVDPQKQRIVFMNQVPQGE